MWHRLDVDPAARRAQDLFDATRSLALGVGPSPVDAGGEVVALVSDSQRWSVLLLDVIAAASDDLKATAEQDSSIAGDATVRWAAGATAIVLASVVLVALLARVLAHPTVALGQAARRGGRRRALRRRARRPGSRRVGEPDQ